MAFDTTGWTLFDTVLGPCAMAWGPRGILAVQLPEADAATTQARLLRTTGPLPQALLPPPAVAQTLLAVADAEVYHAKRDGKNRIYLGSLHETGAEKGSPPNDSVLSNEEA